MEGNFRLKFLYVSTEYNSFFSAQINVQDVLKELKKWTLIADTFG